MGECCNGYCLSWTQLYASFLHSMPIWSLIIALQILLDLMASGSMALLNCFSCLLLKCSNSHSKVFDRVYLISCSIGWCFSSFRFTLLKFFKHQWSVCVFYRILWKTSAWLQVKLWELPYFPTSSSCEFSLILLYIVLQFIIYKALLWYFQLE